MHHSVKERFGHVMRFPKHAHEYYCEAGTMIPKSWLLTSRRACPVCGEQMIYKPRLLTWLTGRYRRICTNCSYADPKEVKFISAEPYS